MKRTKIEVIEALQQMIDALANNTSVIEMHMECNKDGDSYNLKASINFGYEDAIATIRTGSVNWR